MVKQIVVGAKGKAAPAVGGITAAGAKGFVDHAFEKGLNNNTYVELYEILQDPFIDGIVLAIISTVVVWFARRTR